MTWLAPWALAAGALGMLGVVIAHLLSRQRPRALALATARFLPPGMLEATTVQPVLQDRWWMLLRLLIIALVSLAAAQPVLTGARVPTKTVLLLDRTLPGDAQRAALATLSASDVVIAYDTLTTLQAPAQSMLVVTSRSSLGAALGRYVRVRDSLMLAADRLRVIVASPFHAAGLDVATRAVRALVPDSISAMPVTLAPDTAASRGAIVVHAGGDDPIAATVLLLDDNVAPRGTVLERGARVSLADVRAANAGATIVHWPARSTRAAATLQALTMQRTTWIAPMERDTTSAAPAGAEAAGWWADGAPAVWKASTGRGCLLTVRAALPAAGDHTLSLSAQAFVLALVNTCDAPARAVNAAPTWLAAPPARVRDAATPVLASRLAPWLLGAAVALALVELALRAVRPS